MKPYQFPISLACGLVVTTSLFTWSAVADDKDVGAPPRPSTERGAYRNALNALTSQEFVTEAIRCERKEVKSAGVAARRSGDPAVRQFAETLVQRHGQSSQKLIELAERKGLSVPSTNDWEHVAISQAAPTDPNRQKADEAAGTSPAVPSPQPTPTPSQDRTSPADLPAAKDTPAVARDKDDSYKHHRKGSRLEALETAPSAEFDQLFLQTLVDDHAVAIRMFEAASKQLADSELRSYAAETLPVLQEHQKEARRLAHERKLQISRADSQDIDPARPVNTRDQR